MAIFVRSQDAPVSFQSDSQGGIFVSGRRKKVMVLKKFSAIINS